MHDVSAPGPARLTPVQWLICVIAAIGFLFDIYQLLMMPLIARESLAELLNVPKESPAITDWIGYIFWGSAMTGGAFGLVGGYLTDWLGRRRVLIYSILLYAFSAFGAAFVTSAWMLLVLRCTTFVGVCVEFVAAVAWLAELFPNPRQREAVLGYTQIFGSVGGLAVTGANALAVAWAPHLPAIYDGHSAWRYTLISGLIPAIPLMIIRPFLPESPTWQKKKAEGTLKRPSLAELFAPAYRRTTIVTTVLFACAYGAAFGALQLTPNSIVPGLPEVAELRTQQTSVKQQIASLEAQAAKLPADGQQRKEATQHIAALRGRVQELSKSERQYPNAVQTYQELGGLLGRVLLAVLAMVIVSRGRLLRLFQWPGLILFPLVYCFPAIDNLELLKWGIFAVSLFTVAQFSFWGNYLPRVFPTHLRGTGESFAANVGGRMIGTSAAFWTTRLAEWMPGATTFVKTAYAAATVAGLAYLVGLVVSFWLPEPKHEELPE